MEQSISKYKLYQGLTNDISLLIKKLEADINNIVKYSSDTKPIDSSGAKKLRSFWPFKELWVKERPTLKQYLEFKNNIDKIIDEIIFENINIIESYDQVSSIIQKFKSDFYNIIKKYAEILQKDYDEDKKKFIVSTGSPDDVSAADIEKSQKTTATINRSAVESSITRIIKEKQKNTDSVNNNWFANGEIKEEFFGEVLEFLLINDIEAQNEKEIKQKLGNNYTPVKSFYTRLLEVFGSKEKISKVEARIANKDIIIGSSGEILKLYQKLVEKGESAKEIYNSILALDQDEDQRKEILNFAKNRQLMSDVDESQIFFTNIVMNDDLRKQVLNQLDS